MASAAWTQLSAPSSGACSGERKHLQAFHDQQRAEEKGYFDGVLSDAFMTAVANYRHHGLGVLTKQKAEKEMNKVRKLCLKYEDQMQKCDARRLREAGDLDKIEADATLWMAQLLANTSGPDAALR